MRILLLLSILLVTISNCGPMNVGIKEIDAKKRKFKAIILRFMQKETSMG